MQCGRGGGVILDEALPMRKEMFHYRVKVVSQKNCSTEVHWHGVFYVGKYSWVQKFVHPKPSNAFNSGSKMVLIMILFYSIHFLWFFQIPFCAVWLFTCFFSTPGLSLLLNIFNIFFLITFSSCVKSQCSRFILRQAFSWFLGLRLWALTKQLCRLFVHWTPQRET